MRTAGDGASAIATAKPSRPIAAAVACALRWGMLAILLGGLVLRCTIRDRFVGLAWLFYATPPAVLAGLGLIDTLAWLGDRRRWGKLLIVGLTLIGLALSAGQYRFQPTRSQAPGNPASPNGNGNADALELLFWNSARGALGTQRVLEYLRHCDADIIALVEAPTERLDWTAELPGYAVSDIDDGIMLAVRGRIHGIAHWRYDEGSSRRRFDVEVAGHRLWVLVPDLRSSLYCSRQTAMETLVRDAKVLSERPAVIAGDFNLPSDSAWFDPLRAIWTQAFEAAGQGWPGTWPSPLTVMDLDQVWVNRHLRVRRCELDRTLRSDHAAIRVTLEPTRKLGPLSCSGRSTFSRDRLRLRAVAWASDP